MKTRVDDRLRDEARRFKLRFACEDCAHFSGSEPSLDGSCSRSCSLGYPAAPRRRALDDASLELCKEFELA
jgi:hypothetical protein